MSSFDCPIYILAGGQSRRFGSDKARALVGGKTMIEHVAANCSPPVPGGAAGGGYHNITAVSRVAGTYEDLGLRTIADRIPGRGPLSGLHAALSDASSEWIALVSCDLLGLRREWAEALLKSRGEDVQAVVFKDRFWQPMPGLYRSSLKEECELRLNREELSLQSLLDHVRTRSLPLPTGWRGVVQVNTPEELARFG